MDPDDPRGASAERRLDRFSSGVKVEGVHQKADIGYPRFEGVHERVQVEQAMHEGNAPPSSRRFDADHLQSEPDSVRLQNPSDRAEPIDVHVERLLDRKERFGQDPGARPGEPESRGVLGQSR
jgi:hypothetical protein